ncbi:spore germination protein [Alkaliphilus pronyensis]|uniref:Spore germination protein n=1 Tax=Alkaliphilus pronyensis TaxID=1482732 RepID=A0A6I0EZW6_9FIRM|nr:spore germination protein [Alkaliphilus pronyensis]KAB3534867.1 spore germination protein [Alkaliphilus pronyensis]
MIIIKKNRNKLKKPQKLSNIEDRKEEVRIFDDNMTQFTHQLQANINIINEYLGENVDLACRYIDINTIPITRAAIIFIRSIADTQKLEATVIEPLAHNILQSLKKDSYDDYSKTADAVKDLVTNSEVEGIFDVNTSIDALLKGNGILFIDDNPIAFKIGIVKESEKKYADAKTERVIMGPQEAFVEDIEAFVEDINENTFMLRKKINSPHFIVKEIIIGRHSKTKVRIAYLDNLVKSSIVDEVFFRLEKIDVDGIMGSSSVSEYISDSPASLFPTIFSTERPDRIQAMLLEGRVAIISDGSPIALVVPCVAGDFFSTPEDYYLNFYFTSFNRLLGYIGAIFVMFAPSIYIAFTTYHQELLPTSLALTISGTRLGVPYPAFLEALLMEISFEALREAGTRLPIHAGQAVSIVGALIIGQSAVEAGLVSPTVIIVVAFTAIFSLAMPFNNFSMALRLTRFLNMTLAAILGIYGIMTGALIILLTLLSLRAFGTPFMLPFSPLNLQDLKDWVLRFPQWAITKRSSYFSINPQKKADNLKPTPSDEGMKK